jgi:hypothetical protein
MKKKLYNNLVLARLVGSPALVVTRARPRAVAYFDIQALFDVIGFTSMHMCWGGLRWNLV